MKKFLKTTITVLVVILALFIVTTTQTHAKARNYSRTKMAKMVKGTWERYGGHGGSYETTIKITKNSVKFYKDGVFERKCKISKVKKDGNKLILKMTSPEGDKYRYIGTIDKNGKVTDLTYYFDWNGDRVSESSSIFKR